MRKIEMKNRTGRGVCFTGLSFRGKKEYRGSGRVTRTFEKGRRGRFAREAVIPFEKTAQETATAESRRVQSSRCILTSVLVRQLPFKFLLSVITT